MGANGAMSNRWLLVSAALLFLGHGVASALVLQWDAYAAANTGFRVYRGANGAPHILLQVLNDRLATSTTDDTVEAGKQYCYTITAFDATSESAPSNQACTAIAPVATDSRIAGVVVLKVDSEERAFGGAYRKENAADGNPNTFWYTEYVAQAVPLPHTIVLELPHRYVVSRVTYLPRQDGAIDGTIVEYNIFIRDTTLAWGEPIASGAWAYDATLKTAVIPPATGRYVLLEAIREGGGIASTNAAELVVYGKPVPVTAGIGESQGVDDGGGVLSLGNGPGIGHRPLLCHNGVCQ